MSIPRKEADPWGNSIPAHMFLLIMGLILIFTLASAAIVLLRPSPSVNLLTAYELSRALENLPTGKTNETMHIAVRRQTYVFSTSLDPVTQILARALADNAQRPQNAIRLSLARGPQEPLPLLRRELQLYEQSGHFNPVIFGTFDAALQNSDGSWTVIHRSLANAYSTTPQSLLVWLIVWVLIAAPSAWWFSSRIASPIRLLSAATERIGRSPQNVPIPVGGPNELRKAARNIKAMQERLARYIVERTSVLAAIAHDLRTPLARIRFHLAEADPALRQSVDAEISDMERMLTVTLDFAENDTRHEELEPIELSLLIEGLIDDFAEFGHRTEFMPSHEVIIAGRSSMLKRLFSNLIDNAVKYGGEASARVIRSGNLAVVEISDGGSGMSDCDLDRAFEPFYRGEPSRNRRTGGVGLGLSIVKSAAEAHGGCVSLSRLAKGGVCARVTLPIS